MLNRKQKAYMGIVFSLLLVLIIVFISIFTLLFQSKTKILPVKENTFAYVDDYPAVDWEYLWSINPAIIGWVTISGTSINHPIVQAYPENPLHYLTHDIYNNWNPWGAIYLSAECINFGLNSPNSVIYGHNMGGEDQSQFGDLENYINETWARNHSTILLQTPEWKKYVTVSSVEQTTGREATKRTEFINKNDFEKWYAERYAASTFRLREKEYAPEINYTFITCSYDNGNDERTLIYAS